MKINKYYVGAEHIADAINRGTNDNHTHETLKEAIEDGRELVTLGRSSVIIVQIVRVIHRKTPIVVERIV